jgi:cell division septum initiation protein DivIVA
MKPEEIEKRTFLGSFRGYARDEVDSFKKEVAGAVGALEQKLSDTLAELSDARGQLASTGAELSSLRARLSDAEASLQEAEAARAHQEPEALQANDVRSEAYRQVAQETERILMAAEEVAEELQENALREAATIVADARRRAEKVFAELEEAKRSAEQELDRIRESRSLIASQMEDIGRRLSETVARLRVPVELPSTRQAARGRPHADAPRQTSDRFSDRPLRPSPDRYATERQGEGHPPQDRPTPDRYAAERQEAERSMLERREPGDRQALQRDAELSQLAERQALRQRDPERPLGTPGRQPPAKPDRSDSPKTRLVTAAPPPRKLRCNGR